MSDRLVLACEHLPLILARARTITAQLKILHPKLAVEVRQMRGDARGRRAKRSASNPFRVLKANSVDAVVVSVENLPPDLPAGLEISVVCERLVPFQGLVSSGGTLLDELPPGARIGVVDELSRFQLSSHRSDLNAFVLRRALGGSLKRVKAGRLDGFIAPVAELELLGWQNAVSEVLDSSLFLPPVGRGAVALVSVEGNKRSGKWLASLDDSATRSTVEAERTVLCEMDEVDGFLGALGQVSGDAINLEAALWSSDGKEVVRESLSGQVGSGVELGRAMAEKLCEQGADRLLGRNSRSARAADKVPNPPTGGE